VAGPWKDSAAAGLRELGRSRNLAMPLNLRMDEIARAGTIVIVGEDLAATQPIVGLKVHQAARNGANVLRFDGRKGLSALAERLKSLPSPLVLFGPGLFESSSGPTRLAELWAVVGPGGGRLVALDRESNVRGGLAISEAFPERPAPKAPRALYIAGPAATIKPGRIGLVIVQASFRTRNVEAADIVFPEATSFETDGTFVNVEGRIQHSPAVASPPAEARPGWSILAELAARLGRSGFGYGDAADVRPALGLAVPAFAGAAAPGAGEGRAFLIEASEPRPSAGPAAEGGSVHGRRGRVPRDPDDFKGLNLAEESRGLKLVRGR